MAASPVHAAPSKSAKKKAAARAAHRSQSPSPSTASGVADAAADSQHDGFESPYIKELQKNIRNINKKITNASKTDSLLSQHAGKTLDQLVEEKIINADQRTQVAKKPALQAQLMQAEEQLVQYQKVHDQYQLRLKSDKADWDRLLKKATTDAVAEAKQGFNKSQQEHLLVLSQFLRLAAYRREEAKDPESDESQAIEGVLLAIYAGDEAAVASMLKLIQGSEEHILSVPGDELQTTYSDVKSLAREYKTPFYPETAAPAELETAKELMSDPTMANATVTELDAGDGPIVNGASASEALVNGKAAESTTNGIANASVTNDAANETAESHWDCENSTPISQGWEDIKNPRHPNETDTGLGATPAVTSNTQSWADEQPDPSVEAPQVYEANDGFHQVQRNRGRHERDAGASRGRGRGEWRGRGRGRGRGNNGTASRGARRAEEW